MVKDRHELPIMHSLSSSLPLLSKSINTTSQKRINNHATGHSRSKDTVPLWKLRLLTDDKSFNAGHWGHARSSTA